MLLCRVGTCIRLNRLSVRQLSKSNRSASAEPDLESKDVFGTLSVSGQAKLAVSSAEKFLPDDPDGYDKEEFDIEPRKNAYYYKYEINKWARQGSTGLRKALELFHEMKSKARLEPTIFNFNPLIYGCAKAGYTKRAFELYEESLKYIKSPTHSTITCLINACAESPFPEYGLKRLEWLLAHLRVNFSNKMFNVINYNSAIKAYGKLGRLDEASKLIQQMIDENIYPVVDTFNMLLIGCASDQRAGCSLALRVYKRMKLYDIQPNLVTYRLMLRCIRDCEMGSRELIQETFRELPAMTNLNQRIAYKNRRNRSSTPKRNNLRQDFEWAPLITDLASSVADATRADSDNKSLIGVADKNPKPSGESELLTLTMETEEFSLVPPSSEPDKLPNLLLDDHLELALRIQAIQFSKLSYRPNRLLLFGGIKGYIDVMLQNGSKPDNKTFTLLLDCIEHTRDNLLEYHKLAVEFEVQRDRLYYDKLIAKTCFNRYNKSRRELALHFVEQMQLDNEKPNITTFEGLARSCDSWRDARKLLDDLERSGFTASDKLIRELFHAAIANKNFVYLNRMIDLSKQRGFRPTKLLVEKMEDLRLFTHEAILKQEKKTAPPDCHVYTEAQIEEFDRLTSNLANWLENVELQEEEHPWDQFKIDDRSKRDGFMDFVKHFKALEKVKKEALERGGTMSNLDYKARQLTQST